MALGFAELREARPERLAPAAQAWAKLSADLVRLENRTVAEVTGPVRRSVWRGDAADAAFTVFDRMDDEFELAALQTRNIAAVIRYAHTEFTRLHQNLQRTISAATQQGMTITAAGQVHPPPPTPAQRTDPNGQAAYRIVQQNARTYQDLINAIVREAAELDGKVAQALRAFGPQYPGQMVPGEWNDATRDARAAMALLGIDPRTIPAADARPQAVAAWWRGLSEDQRSLYLAGYPDQVGQLNGLPTTARDDANRHELRNLIGAGTQDQRLAPLLNQIEAAEYGPAAQRLYLLDIDNQGDGRAVVSVGNPDTAAHTAVVVPGIRTELDDMQGQITRAGNLQRTADDLTAGVTGDVAVVAWLGYDAPETLNAGAGGRAEAGAPLLDRFVDGLRVSHDTSSSHVTVVGHSYGSTVVGTAASRGDGLATDDIITAGSPGMRVDNVADLRIDARHVWAGHAEGDDVSGWMGGWAHNTEPHRPEFGANRYVVDTTGHSDYWRPDSQSLLNQARIVTGMYDRVDLVHGRPPR